MGRSHNRWLRLRRSVLARCHRSVFRPLVRLPAALTFRAENDRKTAGFPTGKVDPMDIRKLLARVDIDMALMVTLSAVLAVMTCAVIGAILGAL